MQDLLTNTRSKGFQRGQQCSSTNVPPSYYSDLFSVLLHFKEQNVCILLLCAWRCFVFKARRGAVLVRFLREDLCAPACCQRKDTRSQVACWIYCTTTVTGHGHGDPQDDHSHHSRNQLCRSRGVSLFVQTQDAQHKHASAHYLKDT